MPSVRRAPGGGGVSALLSPPPLLRVRPTEGHLLLVWHHRQRDAETHHRLVAQPLERSHGRTVDVCLFLSTRISLFSIAQRKDTAASRQQGHLLCLSRPQDLRHGVAVKELHLLSRILCSSALLTDHLSRLYILLKFQPHQEQAVLEAFNPKFKEFSIIAITILAKVLLFIGCGQHINMLTETTHFTQTQYRTRGPLHYKTNNHLIRLFVFPIKCLSVFPEIPVIIFMFILRYSMMKKYFYSHIMNYKKRWKSVFSNSPFYYSFTWFSKLKNKYDKYVCLTLTSP